MPRANPIKTCPGCTDAEVRKSLPLDQQCTACRKKERHRLWREAHPGAMAANAKRWRQAGNKTARSDEYKARARERERLRYQTSPEVQARVKEANRRRRERLGPEALREQMRQWRAKNLVSARRYHREYSARRRAADPEYRQRCLDSQTLWRHRAWRPASTGLGWVREAASWRIVDGAHIARLHAWQQDRCYLCNHIMKESTVEHIIPRAIGGSSAKQNIVLSCQSCNYSRQHSIWSIDWNPSLVMPDFGNIVLSCSTIKRDLEQAGLNPVIQDDGGFLITGPKASRFLYVISSFQGSDRNPAAAAYHPILAIQKRRIDPLIIIDYEWYERKASVLNALASKVGLAVRGPGARKLDVVELAPAPAAQFLNSHHIMGNINETYRIALTDGDTVHGLGVFSDRDEGRSYECVRLAFRGHVAGGMSRIIEALGRLHGRRPIWTFIDTRYATGEGHDVVGFEKRGRTPETYMWVLPDRLQHQRYFSNDSKCSRNLLYFRQDLSREANIRANGIFRLWIPGRWKMCLLL